MRGESEGEERGNTRAGSILSVTAFKACGNTPSSRVGVKFFTRIVMIISMLFAAHSLSELHERAEQSSSIYNQEATLRDVLWEFLKIEEGREFLGSLILFGHTVTVAALLRYTAHEGKGEDTADHAARRIIRSGLVAAGLCSLAFALSMWWKHFHECAA